MTSRDACRFGHVNQVDAECAQPLLMAALYGQFEVVKAVYNHPYEVRLRDAFAKCIDAYSTTYFTEDLDKPVNVAVRNGYTDIVRFLRESNADMHVYNESVDYAARRGHFEVVKYLREFRREHEYLVDVRTLTCAAENGHMELVQYLFSEIKCVESDTLHMVAERGQRDVYDYLVKAVCAQRQAACDRMHNDYDDDYFV